MRRETRRVRFFLNNLKFFFLDDSEKLIPGNIILLNQVRLETIFQEWFLKKTFFVIYIFNVNNVV